MIEATLTSLIASESKAALELLQMVPIGPSDVRQELGQLGAFAQPAYLPLARASDSVLAIHVRPGTELSASSVVLLDCDTTEVRIVAGSLANVRHALILVGALWMDDWERVIAAAERFGDGVSYLQPVSPDVAAQARQVEPRSVGLWRADAGDDVVRLWRHAGLAHPFAHITKIPFDEEPVDAVRQVDAFVRSPSSTPELVALQICTRARAGRPPGAEAVRTVLSAEAWRERRVLLVGYWRVMGKGIGEWDATLQVASEAEGALTGPFERLRAHPRLYSGEDDEAADVLFEVARDFERAGDWETALNQYRNAAAVAGLSGAFLGRVTRDACFEAIAHACDHIQRDSLAAEIARASARAIAAGL